jgi:hypothetical protein
MNRILTVVLVAVVSVGLVAYALSLTTPEEVITAGNHKLEARPEEIPRTEVPELKSEEPSNIEAGDAVEAPELETYGGDVEAEPEKLPFKMSNGAEKVLKKKLKEEKEMVKSRRKWIKETAAEITELKELLSSVPKESKLHEEFSHDLEVKTHYLTNQLKRLANNEQEVRLIETALGGK